METGLPLVRSEGRKVAGDATHQGERKASSVSSVAIEGGNSREQPRDKDHYLV